VRSTPAAASPALQGTHAVGGHLVQRLDRRDNFYYLIEMHRNGIPTAILQAAGLDGTFHAALSLANVPRSPVISAADATAEARRAVIDRGDG